jgi:hypothetical protein
MVNIKKKCIALKNDNDRLKKTIWYLEKKLKEKEKEIENIKKNNRNVYK